MSSHIFRKNTKRNKTKIIFAIKNIKRETSFYRELKGFKNINNQISAHFSGKIEIFVWFTYNWKNLSVLRIFENPKKTWSLYKNKSNSQLRFHDLGCIWSFMESYVNIGWRSFENSSKQECVITMLRTRKEINKHMTLL